MQEQLHPGIVNPQAIGDLIEVVQNPGQAEKPKNFDAKKVYRVREFLIHMADGRKEKKQLRERFRREDAFIRHPEAASLSPPLFIKPLVRLRQSDLIVLYDSLINNGEVCPERAYDRLVQTRNKNKEEEILDASPSPITVGLEIECFDPDSNNLLELYLMRNKKISEDAVRQNDLETRFKHPRGDMGELAYSLFDAPRFASSFGAQGIRTVRIEGQFGNSEIQTYPSASYRLQLRELLYILQSGGLKGVWNVHVTIGGIELSPENTQVMDVLLMSGAAGFTPQNLLDALTQEHEEYREQFDGHVVLPETIMTENHPKPSKCEDRYYYFPFHKRRNLRELSLYPEKMPAKEQLSAVEQRGALKYGADEFPLLVNHLRFTTLAAYSIAAVQKPEKERTDREIKLALCWKRLRREWNKLLRESSISPLRQKEYYYPYSASAFLYEQEKPYESFFAQIIFASFESDRVFRTKAHAMIRKFCRSVHAIVPGL